MTNSPVNKKMSLFILDDIFFYFDHSHPESITECAVLELTDYFIQGKKGLIELECIFGLFPYVIIPEVAFENNASTILINEKYPHLIPADHQINIDTWPHFYSKCVYYIPKSYIPFKHKIQHVFSGLAQLNSAFFDQPHEAKVWNVNFYGKSISFIKSGSQLRDIKVAMANSPDDSTYHLLKSLESFKNKQEDLIVQTNEKNAHHLSILQKFIPYINTDIPDSIDLIKKILQSTCESYQEA